MAAPLIMGAVLFMMTQQVTSLVMMGLSPIMLVGSLVDQHFSTRRVLRKQKVTFAEGLANLSQRLERARGDERRIRLGEVPSLRQLVADMDRLGAMLWTTRPEHDTFLVINLGTTRLPSRDEVEVQNQGDALPEYVEQAETIKNDHLNIDGVPLVAELRSAGSLGIAAPRGILEPIARGFVFQILASHSPSEVVLASLASGGARAEWDWLKWAPHTSSSKSPLGGVPHLADNAGAALSLLSALEGLIDMRLTQAPKLRGRITERADGPDEPIVPSIVVIVDQDAPVDVGRLIRLAERGPDAGVHVIWCATHVQLLPGACRTFLAADHAVAGAFAATVREGAQNHPVHVESLSREDAERLTRLMSSVVDVGVPDEDDSDLPTAVSYAELAGREVLDSAPSVIERWQAGGSLIPRDGRKPERRKDGLPLKALVGHAGAHPLTLDLRRDGPHALVGGTTGAGKSEFLQTWVLGMAAANSPDRLTFLFVDYKGGAAFAECVDLPHTVGLVTDLSPHLVRRALTSLRAELRHREHLLQRKHAKDLIALEKTGDPECPPSLIIIVDEFAALVNEVPEFVDGVVDVAQRGRSLGLHLILATQRPSGVIKENLRANTNLRVALRMADVGDSVDILDDDRAAHFDPAIPGRAAVKTGPGRIQTFQTGYAGGRTTDETPAPRIEVEELGFGAGAAWELPEPVQDEAALEVARRREEQPSDIKRIVEVIAKAAGEASVPAPRKPWLDTLAPVYNLEKLPSPRSDAKLPLGVRDEPESQSQPPVYYEPDKDGNLAIYGTGGSGKSTALRTIAAAAAFTHRGGPAHVYGLDFGSSGLAMLESLPHVGAIVSGDDDERVARVLRMLRDIVDERARTFAAVSAGTIGEYRDLARKPREPRILLLVDGIAAFREKYEYGAAQYSQLFTVFAQIAADGRGLGVHIVMTAERPNAVPNSVASTVQRRIALRLASEDDYGALNVAKDILNQTSPPGRGILDGNEFQFALLGASSNVAVQAREMDELAEGLRAIDADAPAPVRRLPQRVSLSDLPERSRRGLVIGVDDRTLGSAVVECRGAFMIAGPPQSGRTTALATTAAAVERFDAQIQRVLLSPRRSALHQLRGWGRQAVGPDAVRELAETLTPLLEAGDSNETEQEAGKRFALFIEHLPEFSSTEAEMALDQLVKTAVRHEHFVVGEGESSTWGQAWTLAPAFKSGKRGLLLVPGEMDGDSLLGTNLGRVRTRDFPPGRGFLVQGGNAEKIQVAVSGESW
ncbi:FtsK/SpoIIIE domain-containing protein [Pseudoclavibacter helvolus]|uniref:FtsK/SpoIIIE domain-containing protein n=1 Tax=Pseudoclavibacter helvolus TaxID=255205 RepID=UPI0024AD7F7F|nr:FtsK/SpoIIIE domain-containing protein [Pseudoclavibacter helvolus]